MKRWRSLGGTLGGRMGRRNRVEGVFGILFGGAKINVERHSSFY